MSILEVALERKCCNYAIMDGGQQFKIMGRRGMPDRCFVRPNGKVFFVEFKRHGSKPSELQDYYIRHLRALKAEVHWITCYKHFREIWHEGH